VISNLLAGLEEKSFSLKKDPFYAKMAHTKSKMTFFYSTLIYEGLKRPYTSGIPACNYLPVLWVPNAATWRKTAILGQNGPLRLKGTLGSTKNVLHAGARPA
jgi:hypothetical protein